MPTCTKRSLTCQTQVSPNQPFDQQKQDHAAVEDGNGQQVENAQLQADERNQEEKLGNSRAIGFAGKLRDANGAGKRARRHAPGQDLAQNVEGGQAIARIVIQRSRQRLPPRQMADDHAIVEPEPHAPALFTHQFAVDGLNRNLQLFARRG